MERIARSWQLTRQSYAVLMKDKELMLLPILSGLAILLVCATFVGGFVATGQDIDHVDQTTGALAGLSFYIVTYTIAFFFQAALIAGALQRMNGGDPTLGSALGAASNRLGAILVWGIIAGTVGAILKAIQERSELIGKLVVGLVGVVWSLATYFMVPVLVMEGEPIGVSFKRSTQLFKKTWGETMIGGAGIGLASLLVTLPLAAICVALAVYVSPWIAIAIGLPGIALSMVFFSALQGVYVAALYRYATTGEAADGFEQDALAGAFQRKARTRR